MRFKIHFAFEGEEDYIVLSGETTEEVKTKATEEMARRGITDYWSEEIK